MISHCYWDTWYKSPKCHLRFYLVSVALSKFIFLHVPQPHSSYHLVFLGLLFAVASQAPATWHAQFLLSSALMQPSLLHGVTASQLFSDLGSHRASPRNASLASLTWTNCPGLGSPGPIYLCLYLFTISVCHHRCLTSVSSMIWRIVSVFTHDFVSQWFAQFCP